MVSCYVTATPSTLSTVSDAVPQREVDIPPMSLGQLVVDYQLLPNPGGMVGGTFSVVAGSWISHQLGTEEIS